MRIVFDVTPLSVPRTGIGNYLRGTLAGLVEAAGDAHEIVALAVTGPRGRTAVPAALAGISLEPTVRFLPLARVWRLAWGRLGRPGIEILTGPLDAFHFSDWWYPPQRRGIRATTIHDLVPLRFPQWTQLQTRVLHRAKYRHAARTCDLVFVNSAYTGRDVVETLGVPEERIRVARPGVDPRFRPAGERARLGRPYVLTVATLEPRKNLETLLAAHRLLPDELVLAVAGGTGWGKRPDLGGGRVARLGYVADEELARLYRGAAVFVYPSRFEGFGMPVVEAMASGVPVVASSHPSLDEACGQAALRVDPDSPEAFAAAIERALAERDRLVALGLEHARRFTWSRTGRIFLDAFRELA